jgi:hypothetical protein
MGSSRITAGFLPLRRRKPEPRNPFGATGVLFVLLKRLRRRELVNIGQQTRVATYASV